MAVSLAERESALLQAPEGRASTPETDQKRRKSVKCLSQLLWPSSLPLETEVKMNSDLKQLVLEKH